MRAAILFLSLVASAYGQHVEKKFPTYSDSDPGYIASKADFLRYEDVIEKHLPAEFHAFDYWQPTKVDVIRAEYAVKAAIDVGATKPYFIFANVQVPQDLDPKMVWDSRKFEAGRVQELYNRYFRQFIGLEKGTHKYVVCHFVTPNDLDNMTQDPAKEWVSSQDPNRDGLHFILALVNADTDACEDARLVGYWGTPPGDFHPTTSSKFTGYIVPADYAEQNLYYLGGRDTLSFWDPSENQVDEAYRGALSKVREMIRESPRQFSTLELPKPSGGQVEVDQYLHWHHLQSIVENFSQYKVQFVGIFENGQRYILCNFVHHGDSSLQFWLNLGVPDGGSEVWRIDYDPNTKKYQGYGDEGDA